MRIEAKSSSRRVRFRLVAKTGRSSMPPDNFLYFSRKTTPCNVVRGNSALIQRPEVTQTRRSGSRWCARIVDRLLAIIVEVFSCSNSYSFVDRMEGRTFADTRCTSFEKSTRITQSYRTRPTTLAASIVGFPETFVFQPKTVSPWKNS